MSKQATWHDKPAKVNIICSPRTRSVLIVILGGIATSPDALCLRIMHHFTDSPFNVLFWKGCTLALSMFVLAVVVTPRDRTVLGDLRAWLRLSPLHLAVTCLSLSFYQAGFAISVLFTNPSRALLLMALAPLWAALIGRVFLGERLPLHAFFILSMSCAAVGLIAYSSASDAEETIAKPANFALGSSKLQLIGDCIAVCAGLSLAVFVSALRFTAVRKPSLSKTTTMWLAPTCVATAGLAASLTRGDFFLPTSPIPYLAALISGFGAGAFWLAAARASKHITGTDLALIQLLEDMLDPVIVYLFGFSDAPTTWTIVGGSILLCSVCAHEVLMAYTTRKTETAGSSLPQGSKSASSTNLVCMAQGSERNVSTPCGLVLSSEVNPYGVLP
eukprot:CAMPEP_0119303842 /NCGR_PEP_ID=MMETSP1333-20130426/5214_1 /TAXON_ID=418940 /ORGANISM="Scyphosphaera apsteinii, Strain RCC1455" /LENGTH=387 /DNA_ID=CAMNT_0007306613 /DNA_START=39 /DNA_END=1202 /DNA_ORIENTATION=+